MDKSRQDKIRFSKTAIQALTLPGPGKRLTIYDTETPKLALRVTAAGTKTFYVVKRSGASMAWLKLGTFPEITVEQARKAAALALGEFAGGADPAAARRAVREEPTFAEAFEAFLDGKRKRDGIALADKTKRSYRDVARLYLSTIQSKKLSAITREDVKAAQRKAAKKSTSQACQAVAVVSSVFSFALDQETYSGTSPASRVQKNPPPSRDRFAQAHELPYLLAAVAESDQRDYFLLSLLTGARRANVQAMAWREIDLDGAVWRIGKTKNGTPQNVPLTNEAMAVLNARKAAQQAAHKAGKSDKAMSPFVFPGTGKTGHLVEPKKAWSTILTKASSRRLLDCLVCDERITADERERYEGLLDTAPATAGRKLLKLAAAVGIDRADYDMTDLRIHDLRRTLGSWQVKTGASMAIIGKSLNHKTQQATAIYARLDLDPVRQSVNTATSAMLEAAGLKDKADVVALPKKRSAA
ncbi:site-specific integrase [Thauera aromatica]|uniref:tyrosine-type recombinase/integrase n=1 Tax=Thauera aromatica TaxID=59405 RepID=UPI001FFC99EC|nr:tyrosine-type recombinase/integrase [Thauera aromatica]MCK2086725.1 site-specific integrase [Thauera aromatica]